MHRKGYKIMGLLLTSIFLYSIVPNIANLSDISNNNNLQNDSINHYPLSSDYQVYNMTINGTNFEQDGIYYSFRNDTLNMQLATSTNINTANMTIYNPSGLPQLNLMNVNQSMSNLTTAQANFFSYNLTISNQVPTAMYNVSIILNQNPSELFDFNLSVADPQPRIIETILSQSALGISTSQRIFEGNTLAVYQTAQINVTCYVVKDDNLASISTVQLFYNNASIFTNATASLTKQQNVTISNYLTTLYSLSSNVSISLASKLDNWNNLYF